MHVYLSDTLPQVKKKSEHFSTTCHKVQELPQPNNEMVMEQRNGISWKKKLSEITSSRLLIERQRHKEKIILNNLKHYLAMGECIDSKEYETDQIVNILFEKQEVQANPGGLQALWLSANDFVRQEYMCEDKRADEKKKNSIQTGEQC